MDSTLRTPPSSTAVRVLQAASAPFVGFGRFLVRLGEASPAMVALDRLSATSDDILAERGVNRLDEIRRTIGPRAAL